MSLLVKHHQLQPNILLIMFHYKPRSLNLGENTGAFVPGIYLSNFEMLPASPLSLNIELRKLNFFDFHISISLSINVFYIFIVFIIHIFG